MAATKRESMLVAATQLFLENGYDRTSLARIAQQANVSRATLFKRFPTKAALFEATVLAAGRSPAPEPDDVPSEDFYSGLVTLGRTCAELLTRPEMAALMRTVIAESPRFPELRALDDQLLLVVGDRAAAVHEAGPEDRRRDHPEEPGVGKTSVTEITAARTGSVHLSIDAVEEAMGYSALCAAAAC